MSSIWPSGDPMTLPSRLGATSAGAIIAVIAFGSLTFGLMSGWQRGASHMPGVEILLRLAGVKPNSDAIRIMISAGRLAIAR